MPHKLFYWRWRTKVNSQIYLLHFLYFQRLNFVFSSWRDTFKNKSDYLSIKKCLFERVRKITLKIKVANFDLLKYKNLCNLTLCVFFFLFLVYILSLVVDMSLSFYMCSWRGQIDLLNFCHTIADLSHIIVPIITWTLSIIRNGIHACICRFWIVFF